MRHQHPAYAVEPRELRIESIDLVARDVAHVEMASVDGAPLAPYEPGSHLILELGSSASVHRNAYSLTGDGVSPTSYGISVLRHGVGGGSHWVHSTLKPGDIIRVEGPRSAFGPQHDQKHSLLVAGGIGITPLLSHARAAARWGRSAEIVYAYRQGSGAHIEDVRAIAREAGMAVTEVSGAEEVARVLADRFAAQPIGTHAYACGPIGFLGRYLELGIAAGWPEGRLHLERFEAPELDPGDPFEAIVESTGQRVAVPAGVSLLDALGEAGVQVPSLCRQGVCGECRIPVRAASLEHRDFVLTAREKAVGEQMMCCVSRGTDVEVLW